MSNREVFTSELEKVLAVYFKTPHYAHAMRMTTPPELARRTTEGLITGTASKDGPAVKSTCKRLGIRPTYAAIKAYLLEEEK